MDKEEEKILEETTEFSDIVVPIVNSLPYSGSAKATTLLHLLVQVAIDSKTPKKTLKEIITVMKNVMSHRLIKLKSDIPKKSSKNAKN